MRPKHGNHMTKQYYSVVIPYTPNRINIMDYTGHGEIRKFNSFQAAEKYREKNIDLMDTLIDMVLKDWDDGKLNIIERVLV
jgi:hypothetical protein